MDLTDFQNANGKHLESVGWYEGKNLMDLMNHLRSEVNEMQKAIDADRMLYFVDGKPEGVQPEAADVVLLVLDIAHKLGFDVASAIELKDDYNRNKRGK